MEFAPLTTEDNSGSLANPMVVDNEPLTVSDDSQTEVIQESAKSNLEVIDLLEENPENYPKTDSNNGLKNTTDNNSSSVVVVSDSEDNPCKEVEEIDSNFEAGEIVQIVNDNEEKQGKTEKPCITISFRDENTANLYKQRLVDFLNNFIELEVKFTDELSLNVNFDGSLKSDEWSVIDYSELGPEMPSRKRKKKSKAKKELFVVDTTPSVAENNDLRYTSKFRITDEKEDIRLQTCFNCDGHHSLKDCLQPKNYEKINAARQKQKQTKSRYHLEDEQKFSHLQPGIVSSGLRHALGLRKNELPHFVYLMRRMGYPPGWLEEAKMVHSNLELFDCDGKNVKVQKGKKRGLDEAKIVDFPGFNVPLGKGMKDDFRNYGVPPYSENFSKNSMVEYFSRQCAANEDDLESCDMEIDENGLENDKVAPHVSEKDEVQTSLTDLEQEKRKLLQELNDTSQMEPAKTVKTTSFGTPILKSRSPFMKLPNPDNFSKDVSPMINFENLPNSIGKYEQMTDVLKKVRTTMKNIQST